jgi:hypothetical protein
VRPLALSVWCRTWSAMSDVPEAYPVAHARGDREGGGGGSPMPGTDKETKPSNHRPRRMSSDR